jgi:Na+/melibiose symporter-like transporter
VIIFACASVIIAIWGCAAMTFRHVDRLSVAPIPNERFSLLFLLREIVSTFKNRNYLTLMIGYFFFMITSGIYETFNVFINTYFWELAPKDIKWFGVAVGPMIILGALVSPLLQRKFDRKPVILGALIFMTIFAQLVIDLRLLGLLPANGSEHLLPILVTNAGAFAFTIGLGGVAIAGMIGDLVDENELLTGLRQDGLFYSARAFFGKASLSIGHLFAGMALDLYVVFPFEAVPGQVDEATITRMGIVAGPVMALSAMFAVFIYSRYDLTAAKHSEILAELEKRTVDDNPTG